MFLSIGEQPRRSRSDPMGRLADLVRGTNIMGQGSTYIAYVPGPNSPCLVRRHRETKWVLVGHRVECSGGPGGVPSRVHVLMDKRSNFVCNIKLYGGVM